MSPFVGGRSVKGPTEPFCEQAGIELSAAGIARAYAGVIDGVVADEPSGGGRRARDRHADGHTRGPRARLAREVLDFAASLRATR